MTNSGMESLPESEQLLRSIASAAKDAIVMADSLGNICYWNPAAENMFGYQEDEVIGEFLIGTVFSESSAVVSKERLERFGKTGTDPAVGETSEMQAKRKDGTEFPMEVSLSRVKIRDQWYSVGIMRDISKRRMAEQALRESEDKYRRFYEDAPLGYQSLDASDNFLDVNKEWLNILGFSKEEVIGRRFADFVAPEFIETFVQNFPCFRASGKIRAIEFEMIKKDGSRITVSLDGNVEYDQEGHFRRTHCIIHDITERKKAEQALQESEIRYKAVVDNAQEGIAVVQDKMIRFVNPAVIDIMGYTEDELTSKIFIEFVHPDDREQVMKIHLKRFKGEEVPPVYEVRIVDKQGETKWLENNGILIEWGGRPATLNFLRDVTSRKKTDEELKKHQYYLEKAQELGEIGTWELDLIQNKLVWTDENCRIFGVPEGSVVNYEIFLSIVHPDDREYVDKKWKAALNKEPYDIEHRIIVDGEVKWVREKADVEYDEHGKATSAIGFTQDITNRKEAEEQMRQERDRAQKYLDIAEVMFVVIDTDQIVRLINQKGCKVLGYNEKDIINNNWFDNFLPESIRKEVNTVFKKLVAGEIEPVEYFENHVLTKDGDERLIAWHNTVLRDEQGRITATLTSGEDITERKKAEETILENQAQLKSLASQLSLTEESERRRIATELHDQIGQSLVFSKIKLDELHQSATSSELTKALDEICNNIGRIIQDTRTLTFDLSSPILNELGLEAAVAEWLDVQIREKHGIETEFVDDGQQKLLDDDIRALLFRNLRELLVNVIKHADAHKVKVSIRRVNEHIHINVEDDGKGFDAVKVMSTAIEETKFGLFSIRQRLEQLGGQFEIDTEERRGSKITMTAPLKLTISKK